MWHPQLFDFPRLQIPCHNLFLFSTLTAAEPAGSAVFYFLPFSRLSDSRIPFQSDPQQPFRFGHLSSVRSHSPWSPRFLSCLVLAMVSPPQSHRQRQIRYFCSVMPVFSITVNFPNLFACKIFLPSRLSFHLFLPSRTPRLWKAGGPER